jgi:transposase
MRCEFLPPYSPDYNPIEFAFSAIKANFRHRLPGVENDASVANETDILMAIQESVFSITFQDAYGWFSRCGYV